METTYSKNQDEKQAEEQPRQSWEAFVPDLECIPEPKTLPYWLIEILDQIA